MPAPVDPSDPFRALSDPTRREIVSLLASGPLPVRLIAGRFPGISRPAVSKHLRILRVAGILSEERAGRERFYRLERGKLETALEWLSALELTPVGAARQAKPVRRKPRRRSTGEPPRPRQAAPRKQATKPAGPRAASGPADKRRSSSGPVESDWKSW